MFNPHPSRSLFTDIMTSSTDTSASLADRYAGLAAGFGAVLDAVGPDDWTAPSPCAGWTARDVVAHVIDTQRDFLTGHHVDAGPAPSLHDPAAAWRSHSHRVADAVADPDIANRSFDGHFGPTSVGETLLRFYGFDMVAHRWDVATAVGAELRFTDDELTMMETAADGFGEALYSDGVCERVEIPDDADRQTILLARLGRRS